MKKTATRQPPPAQNETEAPPATPLAPRPRLFIALLVLFAIWLGILLTLYFKTVYPLRYPSTAATRPGASALPSAPR
jgi:hypothetical protein